MFRLGGEDGDGSLIQKMQTILGRSGVVLEFGEDEDDEEGQRSSSPVPSEAHSTRSKPIIHRSPLRPVTRAGAAAPEPGFGRLNEQPKGFGYGAGLGRGNEQARGYGFGRATGQPYNQGSGFANKQPSAEIGRAHV